MHTDTAGACASIGSFQLAMLEPLFPPSCATFHSTGAVAGINHAHDMLTAGTAYMVTDSWATPATKRHHHCLMFITEEPYCPPTPLSRFRIKPDFISRQTEVNEKMRAILCDWLVEVHTSFKVGPRTVRQAVQKASAWGMRQHQGKSCEG